MRKEDKKEELSFIDLGKEFEKSKPYIDKFDKAKHFNSSRQDSYAENMAFYQGNQHLLKKYKNDVPWVVNMNTPYAAVAIDNRVSSLLANDYIGDLLPLSADDVDSVDALDKVFKREWKRMDIDDLIRDSISDSAVVRETYCHIIVNPKKSIGAKGKKNLGRLEAYLIEPARIYIDPVSRNLKDARYCFVADRISKEEAAETYDKIRQLRDVGSNNFTPSDRGEVYYDNDYTTEQEEAFTKLTYYGKDSNKIKRVTLVNGIVVEEKTLEISRFPIAQLRWFKAAQSCYGLSLMDRVLSLQKAITSIESAITNTAMSYAAPSMMVRKGCGVDPKVVAKANGAPGVVYSVDGNLDNAIKPVVPPKIQQEILNIKSDFEAQIDKVTGNTSQFLGDIGSAGNTSGGTEKAINRATIIENKVLKNIKEYVEDITEIVVEYITKLYPGEVITYNDGKNGDGGFSFTEIQMPSKADLEGTEYQYYIELDTKTPYNKQRQKELLLEIYQLERQYDTPVKTVTVSDIIKNTDLEDKDVIINRFNNLSFQDAQTKADTITQLLNVSNEIGVDQGLVNQALAEIIDNRKDTPALDQVQQAIEQAFQAQVQQNEQQINAATEQLMATPAQQAQVQQMASQLENGSLPLEQTMV